MISIEDIRIIVNCYIKTDDINISGDYVVIIYRKSIDNEESMK